MLCRHTRRNKDAGARRIGFFPSREFLGERVFRFGQQQHEGSKKDGRGTRGRTRHAKPVFGFPCCHYINVLRCDDSDAHDGCSSSLLLLTHPCQWSWNLGTRLFQHFVTSSSAHHTDLSCVTDSNRTPAQGRERALAPGIPMATDCQNRQMVMEIIEVAGSLLSQADDDAHHRKKEAELTRIRGLAARGRQRAKS